MKARTSAVVLRDGALAELHCEPPLTLRRITAGDRHTCALCLVGSAAGPLDGDDLTLAIRVDANAQATLQATAATIAQGHGGAASSLRCEIEVGAGGRLSADPGALVVCDGSRIDVSVRVNLAADAGFDWREVVVLGRTGDARTGIATIRWDIERAGRPVLRQSVDTSAWPDAPRVLANRFVTGPGIAARTVAASPRAVAQQVDAHSVLVTVLGASAAAVTRQLDALHQAPRA